jgi:hypothetical protein
MAVSYVGVVHNSEKALDDGVDILDLRARTELQEGSARGLPAPAVRRRPTALAGAKGPEISPRARRCMPGAAARRHNSWRQWLTDVGRDRCTCFLFYLETGGGRAADATPGPKDNRDS